MNTSTTKDTTLGTIKSKVVGLQYCEPEIDADTSIHFQRQRENEYDENAVGVFNEEGELAGHLPRYIVRWLAPLIDAGQVRLTGTVLDAEAYEYEAPVEVSIHLAPKGKSIFEVCDAPQSAAEILHQMVLRAYNGLDQCQRPEEIASLHAMLKPLRKGAMAPQTQLIYELLPAKAAELHTQRVELQRATLPDRLRNLPLGQCVHYRNLTVFPVLSENAQQRPYVLLEESLENQSVELAEIDEDGDVPTLKLINHAKTPVMIPEGQVVTGGKQNRMINITILVAAQVTMTIPVSCVEQGRWHDRGSRFQAACYAPPSLRGPKSAAVRELRDANGTFEGDQNEVWDRVQHSLSSNAVDSETQSLTDGYEAVETRTKAYLSRITLPKNTCGALVAIGGRVVGMDVFDDPATFARTWQMLGESYAIEALNQPEARPCEESVAREFLDSIAEKMVPVIPAPGIGCQFEIDSEEFAGGSLVYQDRLCHLAAFPISS